MLDTSRRTTCAFTSSGGVMTLGVNNDFNALRNAPTFLSRVLEDKLLVVSVGVSFFRSVSERVKEAHPPDDTIAAVMR